ncbi:MAG: biopolymer transporter [Cyanobacteria bacterium P01_A01_bin.3]
MATSRWWKVFLTATLGLVLYGCGGQRPLPAPSALTGVRTAFDEYDPNLSANGRYLVFTSNRDNSHNVYLYDLQSRRLINLPGLNSEQFTAVQPAVSNNGRFIVFVSNRLGKSEIFLYDRETRGFENISRGNPGDVRNPSISGDGGTIAYEQNSLGQWDVEVFLRGENAPLDVEETPAPAQ